jgi:hypothetical protein
MHAYDCRIKLADPHQGAAGVRIDIQSSVLVEPNVGNNAHSAVANHFWMLSCPHCDYPSTRYNITVPVNLGRLEEHIAAFAKQHDMMQRPSE